MKPPGEEPWPKHPPHNFALSEKPVLQNVGTRKLRVVRVVHASRRDRSGATRPESSRRPVERSPRSSRVKRVGVVVGVVVARTRLRVVQHAVRLRLRVVDAAHVAATT